MKQKYCSLPTLSPKWFRFENLSSSLTSITLRGKKDEAIRCYQDGTGFYFGRMQSVYLVNITVKNCGFCGSMNAGNGTSNPAHNLGTALYFMECYSVTFVSVAVLDSRGSGVTMLNIKGNTSINHSRFERSTISEGMALSSSGGNGFYLVISIVNNSHTSFKDCFFLDNVANTSKLYYSASTERFGVGGGLYVSIGQDASRNIVTLEDCTVSGNDAIWGGGAILPVLWAVPRRQPHLC